LEGYEEAESSTLVEEELEETLDNILSSESLEE